MGNSDKKMRAMPTDLIQGEELLHSLVTGTTCDTGRWFHRPRLRLALTPTRLLLYAPGPRPFQVTLPLDSLAGAVYNHVTGQWVLPLPKDSPARCLRLLPSAVRTLEDTIQTTHTTHA